MSRVFPALSVISSIFSVQPSRLCRHPSIRVVERFSLGASWVFLIQQVLLSSTRPLLPSFVREVWASRQSQSPELGGRARLFGCKTFYAAARITFWVLRSGS